MDRPAAPRHWADVLGKLRREMEILSELGRRVEYAFSDGYFDATRSASGTDLQMLDLLIQSTDALEAFIGLLTEFAERNASPDVETAANAIPLRDMAGRLGDFGADSQQRNPQRSNRNDVELF